MAMPFNLFHTLIPENNINQRHEINPAAQRQFIASVNKYMFILYHVLWININNTRLFLSPVVDII